MTDTLPADAETQRHIFRKCLPMRVRLQELVRALGPTDDQVCLEIGVRNGMISYHLRKRGGRWNSVALDEHTAEHLKQVVEENVTTLTKKGIPFKKKTFDCVVIVNALEFFEDDGAFIEECHRVMKSNGRLVLHVARRKPFSLIGPFRSALGITYQKKGKKRPGYAEPELFSILKHGFDVHSMRTYSRFFVELVDAVVERLTLDYHRGHHEKSRSVRRIYTLAAPFYWLADQLDLLLFLTRGYSLVATAKRRTWRPRNAPILSDGRTISEAVLSTPGV